MSKKFSKVLLVVIVLILLISSVSFANPINVYYFGDKVNMPVEPIIQNGRVLVPLRSLLDIMQFETKWDSETKTVTTSRDSLEVVLKIDSKYAQVTTWDWDVMDEVTETIELDAPATIVNGHTLVPLRIISECMGNLVEWDGASKSVYIKSYPSDYDPLYNY